MSTIIKWFKLIHSKKSLGLLLLLLPTPLSDANLGNSVFQCLNTTSLMPLYTLSDRIDDAGSKYVCDIDQYLPNYTVQRYRRQTCSRRSEYSWVFYFKYRSLSIFSCFSAFPNVNAIITWPSTHQNKIK